MLGKWFPVRVPEGTLEQFVPLYDTSLRARRISEIAENGESMTDRGTQARVICEHALREPETYSFRCKDDRKHQRYIHTLSSDLYTVHRIKLVPPNQTEKVIELNERYTEITRDMYTFHFQWRTPG